MNNIFKSKENLSQLENMGIFQLRELAREIGVHLPTTLKKNDLIEKIRGIANGDAEPFVSTTKKGRPPKSYCNSSTDAKEAEVIYDYRNWGKFDGTYAIKARDVAYRMADNDSMETNEKNYSTTYDTTGVIFIDKQGFARLHEGDLTQIGTNKVTKILPSIVNKYKLKNGDLITGKIGESIKDGTFYLFELHSINDSQNCDLRKEYSEFKAQPVTTQIKLDDKLLNFTNTICPLGKGQRALVKSKDGGSIKNFLHRLANNFSKKLKTYYIVIDEQPENIFIPDNNNLQFILCPFDLEKEKQLYVLELALENAKRNAENGEDICVILEDINIVQKLYQRYYTNTCEPLIAQDKALQAVKQILAMGKNANEFGSITFVTSLIQNEVETDFDFEVSRACNSFIYINTYNNFVGINLDIDKTYTQNIEKILGEDCKLNYELREKCRNKDIVEINKILSA